VLPFAPASAQTHPLDEVIQNVQRFIQARDLRSARAELNRGLKDYPSEGGLFSLLGVIEAQEGNYTAAEAAFKRAITAIPRFTGAYLNLGRLYQENAAKDPEALKKAIETYDGVLRFQPANTEALYQSAFLALGQKSYEKALERLARLPAEAQEYPQALAIRCAALAATGRHAEAAVVADRLLANADATDADVDLPVAHLEAHGASDLAEELVRAQAEQRQPSYESFYALGLFYKRQRRLDAARDALEKAAQYRPHDVPLLLDLARVAYDQKDRKAALGYLAHARDLQPQNAGIHYFWGVVCIEESLAQEAYNALKRAVELDPENPYYNYALGSVIVQRTDASEAIPYLQKYRALRPHDPAGRLALGAAFMESYEYEKAKAELREAAKDPKAAGGAHFYLGRVANQTGELDEAVRELQAALQIHPDAPEIHAELGSAYLKLKNYPEATKALERAIELRPESYTANLNLMILYQRTRDPRAKEQSERFQEIREKWDKSRMEMLRTIQVQP
jgi:tetratricopeptide (TPR) repeat protein